VSVDHEPPALINIRIGVGTVAGIRCQQVGRERTALLGKRMQNLCELNRTDALEQIPEPSLGRERKALGRLLQGVGVELVILCQFAKHGRDIVRATAQPWGVGEVEGRQLSGGDPDLAGRGLLPGARQSGDPPALREAQVNPAEVAVGSVPIDGDLQHLRPLMRSAVQFGCGQPAHVVLPTEVGHARVDELQAWQRSPAAKRRWHGDPQSTSRREHTLPCRARRWNLTRTCGSGTPRDAAARRS
jgi:hypothetical protein